MPTLSTPTDTTIFSPKALHDLAKSLYPKGYHSGNRLSLVVEDQMWELRFAMHRGPFVVVMLHLPGTDYARFNVDIMPTGELRQEPGVIPKFDLRPKEPTLPNDVLTVLSLIYQRLLHLQKLRQRRTK